jgi:hypothetical protein
MATAQITPTTVSAMRKVFAALEDNFDAEKGVYLHGYSDERIAKETGISVDGVKKYRIDGFGKLRPPTELDIVKREIDELTGLFVKFENEMKEKLKDARARILTMQRRYYTSHTQPRWSVLND